MGEAQNKFATACHISVSKPLIKVGGLAPEGESITNNEKKDTFDPSPGPLGLGGVNKCALSCSTCKQVTQ